MRGILFFMMFLFCSNLSLAQDVDDVLKKLRATYTKVDRIEYETRYELFRGHKTTEVHSFYEGYVYRNNGRMYQKIHDTELVYGADYSLKINTEEKIMQLGLKEIGLELEVDIEEFLKHCKNKSIKEFSTYYSVTLTIKDESPIPLGVVKMRVNKDDYTLQQLDLYYSDFLDFSTDFRKPDLQPSHLCIKFKSINTSPEKKDYLFQLSRYVQTNKGVHSPSSKYKDFQFLDARI